jgi:hypothetical protein
MAILQITPLAPVYVLLVSATLILVAGPALAARRHWLMVAGSALAAFGLLNAQRLSGGAPSIHVLTEWLGEPALVVRATPFEPFLWVLMLSLLAISLAEREAVKRLLSPLDYPALSQVMLFVLMAAAYGVILAGTYRSLAFALLVFDGVAALFWLVYQRPGAAVGRLWLGVLSSASVIALTGGIDRPSTGPLELGGLFSLTLWLRVGLYPLVEGDAPGDSLPVRLGWMVANLAAGLYLASAGVAAWVVWLAEATTLLHGVLAWLEPSRERALAHMGYTLAGGILVMTAASGDRAAAVVASLGVLAALAALELTPPRVGRLDVNHPQQAWVYLPPLLATATLAGLPFTLGWAGRGALYGAAWESGAPGTLALAVVAEGAALSALYHVWRGLPRGEPAEATRIWRPLGAALATIPFLIPAAGPRLLQGVGGGIGSDPQPLNAALGLVGALLWAVFLGYGRPRLLDAMPFSRAGVLSALRLGWMLDGLGRALDTLSRIVLRLRAVVEGEHYLAWAILLALGLGLLIALGALR